MKGKEITDFIIAKGCFTCMVLRKLILKQENAQLHAEKEFLQKAILIEIGE